MRIIRIILIMMVMAGSMSAYGQAGRPLGKEGYVMAEMISTEMRNKKFRPGRYAEDRIGDIRRMTLLRVMPTDTIYGLFGVCSFYSVPYYELWSSVDEISLSVIEAPGHDSSGCFYPHQDKTEYVRRVFLGLEVPDPSEGFPIFVVRIVYEGGKVRLLDSKRHMADISMIIFD